MHISDNKKKMKLFKILILLVSILLILTFLTGCSDNKNYIIIIEKNGVDQYSFAKSITSNDDKSVRFIDENGREQFMTGDYITTAKLKSNDQYLIISKSNGVSNLIFAKSICSISFNSISSCDSGALPEFFHHCVYT